MPKIKDVIKSNRNMKKKEYGIECPKCKKIQSINYANIWNTNKRTGGVEMNWSCNNCCETFIK